MIIASQKKQENIIEYVLYMWQVEDLIRANKLDMSSIETNIIKAYNQPEEKMAEIKEWWSNLVEMMTLENKQTKGHLQVNINTVSDINQLHQKLMKHPNEIAYQHQFNSIAPFLKEFDAKSGNALSNDIEICLTAIYSSFLLKLKGQTISTGTQQAIESISKFLNIITLKYHKDQAGKLDLD